MVLLGPTYALHSDVTDRWLCGLSSTLDSTHGVRRSGPVFWDHCLVHSHKDLTQAGRHHTAGKSYHCPPRIPVSHKSSPSVTLRRKLQMWLPQSLAVIAILPIKPPLRGFSLTTPVSRVPLCYKMQSVSHFLWDFSPPPHLLSSSPLSVRPDLCCAIIEKWAKYLAEQTTTIPHRGRD